MPLQVTPKSISLRARETQVFQAAGAAGSVNWTIEPNKGRINQHGVYTAPLLIGRNASVTVLADDGTGFDSANVKLDAGWFWIHLLGVYWVALAAIVLAILLWRWEALCPSCRPAELLLNPPVATVTASQPVRFTATSPVTWQDNMNASGLYIAPAIEPPNPSISITATAVADSKIKASASLVWSPEIGMTLQPQNATLSGGGQIDFSAILTAPPGKAGKGALSQASVMWLQPSIGQIIPGENGAATYKSGDVKRAATIMIMANVSVAGGPLRPAGAYLTLLPKSPAGRCGEDGTPSTSSLIALIALAGALGGLIHGASSFAIFVGNRQFKASWTWWYFLRPVMGAVVALVVYLVVRGGMGTGDLSLTGADCLKTAGFAGLIGMFAEPAMLKLKDIFNTIFTPRDDPRKDELNPEKTPPRINSIDPGSVPVGSPVMLKIAGANFTPDCMVKIGANVRTPRLAAAALVEVELHADDVANAGDLPIRVCNTPVDSDCSNTVNLKVV